MHDKLIQMQRQLTIEPNNKSLQATFIRFAGKAQRPLCYAKLCFQFTEHSQNSNYCPAHNKSTPLHFHHDKCACNDCANSKLFNVYRGVGNQGTFYHSQFYARDIDGAVNFVKFKNEACLDKDAGEEWIEDDHSPHSHSIYTLHPIHDFADLVIDIYEATHDPRI